MDKDRVIEKNKQALSHDVVQVRNFKKQKSKLVITQDTNYHSGYQEIADDTKFIREIRGEMISYPDVTIFMYHALSWGLFRGLLNRKDVPFISLFVDTTFEVTDGDVTVLVTRFVEFSESPVFPLATMIHERKLGETHRLFWQKLASLFLYSIVLTWSSLPRVKMDYRDSIAILKTLVIIHRDGNLKKPWSITTLLFQWLLKLIGLPGNAGRLH